jgi:uncharacterized protein YqhQ
MGEVIHFEGVLAVFIIIITIIIVGVNLDCLKVHRFHGNYQCWNWF